MGAIRGALCTVGEGHYAPAVRAHIGAVRQGEPAFVIRLDLRAVGEDEAARTAVGDAPSPLGLMVPGQQQLPQAEQLAH